MRKHLLAAGLVMACALMASGSALGDSSGSESLALDTYSPLHTGAAGPVSSQGSLQSNALYVVRVQGTFSAYLPSLWAGSGEPAAVPCGTPESAPLFASPAGPMTGPVGQDAETIYAAIEKYGCRNAYPRHYTNFQMNLGSGFAHYEPFGGAVSSPSADHTYTYVVTGQGSPIEFEQIDSNTTDNYGQYRISITLGTDFCKNGGWQTFGVFRNQGDCVSYFATDGRNPPALLSSVSTDPPENQNLN